VAVVVAVAIIVAAAAALVREVALAADETRVWQATGPIADWVGQTSWSLQALAAAAAAAAVALVVLVLRELDEARRGPVVIEFADDGGRAQVDLRALSRAMRSHCEREVPGLSARALELGRDDETWVARLEAEAPAADLTGAHRRLHDVLAADLARTGGMRLGRLDLVVRRLRPPG
jgi:hypothetical protein